ncbi:replicative DNA helicase [Agromyces tardus]|uniref:replicative DNA helicase n=1 Tax=Agromyces tardus TaxID=2583849 RepID=UPI00361C59AD
MTDYTDEPIDDDYEERAVLGAIMSAPDEVRDDFLALDDDAWATNRTKVLAGVIAGMLRADRHVDPHTVLAEAKNQGLTPVRVAPDFVFTCQQEAAVPVAATSLVDALRNRAIADKMAAIAERMLQRAKSSRNAGSDPDDIAADFAYAKNAFAELENNHGNRGDSALRKFGTVIPEFWEWQNAPPNQVRTIQTPWPELDDALSGGLQPGRSYLFAGRPGGGKSLALTNIAAYAAEHGYAGALFSVEMGTLEVASRILAAGGRAEYGQITRRQLDERNHDKVLQYAEQAKDIPLWICDRPTITIEQIRTEASKLKRSQGLDFLAVDYVQLLKATDSKAPRERQIADISRGLKMLAKELDVAVISACQLNRGATKEKRPPTIAELRESGALEQDSDVVVLIHHNLNDDQPTGEVDFIIGKNRTGKLMTITLMFRGHQARIG